MKNNWVIIIILIKGKRNPLTKIQTIYESKKLEINKQDILTQMKRKCSKVRLSKKTQKNKYI